MGLPARVWLTTTGKMRGAAVFQHTRDMISVRKGNFPAEQQNSSIGENVLPSFPPEDRDESTEVNSRDAQYSPHVSLLARYSAHVLNQVKHTDGRE